MKANFDFVTSKFVRQVLYDASHPKAKKCINSCYHAQSRVIRMARSSLPGRFNAGSIQVSS